MRASHERKRTRIEKSIIIIRDIWKENIKNWNFNNLKKEHFRQMTRTTTRISNVNKACNLLIKIVIERLKRNRDEQKMRKIIIESDWKNIIDLFNDEVLIMLKRFAFLPVLLKAYKFVFANLNLFVLMHKIIESNFFEESMKRKRYRFKSLTNAAMSNTFIKKNVETEFDSNLKDNAKENDENVIQSTSCRKKDKQSDCLCVNVKHEFIKRMKRSFASKANMRNITNCLKVIYYFLNISQINDLRHVCFRHIQNVIFHLRLSINVFDLNADLLRNRLKQNWEKRVFLKLFKKKHLTW